MQPVDRLGDTRSVADVESRGDGEPVGPFVVGIGGEHSLGSGRRPTR